MFPDPEHMSKRRKFCQNLENPSDKLRIHKWPAYAGHNPDTLRYSAFSWVEYFLLIRKSILWMWLPHDTTLWVYTIHNAKATNIPEKMNKLTKTCCSMVSLRLKSIQEMCVHHYVLVSPQERKRRWRRNVFTPKYFNSYSHWISVNGPFSFSALKVGKQKLQWLSEFPNVSQLHHDRTGTSTPGLIQMECLIPLFLEHVPGTAIFWGRCFYGTLYVSCWCDYPVALWLRGCL